MRSPRFLPRELISRRQIFVLTVFSALKAVGLLLVAYALGRWIANMAGGVENADSLVWLALGGALARTAGVWGLNVGSRRMGLGAKERLRDQLITATAHRPEIAVHPAADHPIPLTATLASHGIDKLDDYFTKFIPAMIGAVLVPLLLGLYILRLDWISAVVLILTVPLIPVFMALIGMHTQDTLKASQSTMDALAHQLYELAQGLPALLGLGSARRHGNAMAGLGEKYRVATMRNLKTVFLSSFWLELLATLSVAVLAVMIGVRLVGGGMELSVGLTILILAPELFSALREVGSAYHAADDGLSAYQKYSKIMATRTEGSLSSAVAHNPANLLEVRDLSMNYAPGQPVYEKLNLSLAPGQHTVLAGASGSGKSTLLTLIAESQSSDAGFDPQRVTGQIYVGAQLAVIGQHPRFNAHTGHEQLAQDVPGAEATFLAGLAQRLELGHLLAQPIAQYSPGELRRLEVLRALLRLHTVPGCRLLLADEPTAHLDAKNAAAVRELLAQLPEGTAALIASHDPLLADPARADTQPAVPHPNSEPMPAQHRAEQTTAPSQPLTPDESSFRTLRELLSGYRSAKLAILYGTLGVMCAVALAALSGWLIVEASYQPPILLLSVAFVMVRALGIGRAGFRYLEQLAIHDAVLRFAGALREKIWNSMVANPAGWGLVSRSAVILRFLLAEVDELRDLLARVLFPPIQAIIVWLGGTVVLYQLQPNFAWCALAVGVLIAVPGRALVRRAEGAYLSGQLRHRLHVNQAVLGILRNKRALRAYTALDRTLEKLHKAEAQNTEAARRHALGQGIAPALGALASTLLAIACAAMSHTSAEYTALAVLLALGLGEVAGNALAATQQGRALAELSDQLAARGVGNTGCTAEAAHTPQSEQQVAGFQLHEVTLGYAPGEPVLTELNARIEPGVWTAITGPSGSGKSTLLTALLGALPVRSGDLWALDAQGNRCAARPEPGGVAWCPQEAHLFDASLRRNLLLGVPEGVNVGDAQLVAVLQQVALGDWFAEQPRGLDTRIGSGGHNLSGGQRCKLAVARALLGGHRVILLDEPTAHLGQDEGEELMATLRVALAGFTVVLITHEARLAQECQARIELGQRALVTG